MDIQNFIAEFKKTFVYDLLSQTLTDEQLFEHAIDDDGVTWFKEQMRQMWLMWEKAQAVPEGFVLVPKEPTEAMIQRGTKANSECLNENAPLGERLFRHPALQVYQAMVNGSGE